MSSFFGGRGLKYTSLRLKLLVSLKKSGSQGRKAHLIIVHSKSWEWVCMHAGAHIHTQLKTGDTFVQALQGASVPSPHKSTHYIVGMPCWRNPPSLFTRICPEYNWPSLDVVLLASLSVSAPLSIQTCIFKVQGMLRINTNIDKVPSSGNSRHNTITGKTRRWFLNGGCSKGTAASFLGAEVQRVAVAREQGLGCWCTGKDNFWGKSYTVHVPPDPLCIPIPPRPEQPPPIHCTVHLGPKISFFCTWLFLWFWALEPNPEPGLPFS